MDADMFPRPIQKASPASRVAYKVALPIALIFWLLPLIAVAITSIRSAGDITAGNYWGWPTSINLVENYTAIFTNSPIGQYIFNSFQSHVFQGRDSVVGDPPPGEPECKLFQPRKAGDLRQLVVAYPQEMETLESGQLLEKGVVPVSHLDT